MKILILGGSGFIGLNFSLYTQKHYPEHKIIVADNLEYSSCPTVLKENKIPLFIKDITKINDIEPLIKNTDLVINFAAQSHNDNSFTTPNKFIQTNIVGTYNIISLCSKYNKRYHHVSTDEVFGPILESENIQTNFTTNTPYNPTSPYSASKASADLLVKAWIYSYNLQATISYSCNNYGPYQHIEKFIPRSITSILTNRKPHVYGTGKQIRQWIHVEDHCAAIWEILNNTQTGTYMISSPIEKTNLEVIETINKHFNKNKTEYIKVSDRKYHDFQYKTDYKTFNKQFNFKYLHTDFEIEIAKLCQWYKENSWFWETNKTKIEEKYALDNK